MKATPKLQETLEVFLDEIESLKESISKTKPIGDVLQNKIEELKDIKIEPDLRQFQTNKDQFLMEFGIQINKLNLVFNNNYQEFDKLLQKNKSSSSKFVLYLLFAFLIALSTSFFWINAQFSNSKLQDEIKLLKSYNNSLEGYIRESKEINKYNKWLDEKTGKK